jgi:putative endonuclease
MKQGYVYILANTSRTLYTGVTSDLEQRIWQHKSHGHDGFTKRYNVTRLVWFVEFSRIDDAIAFEKSLKGKSRAKKIALIEESNPRWNDLAWDWFGPEEIIGFADDSASRGDSSLRSE